MHSVRLVAGLALALAGGCYRQVVYEQTLPEMEPISMQGPPGGGMDPGYGYQDPGAYGQSQGGGAVDQNLTGTVNDGEIQTTLAGNGEWVWTEEYGYVWRPYDTVVGADFTPYESCGEWVNTEYGWTWQSCAEWSWGWLAFHYGQWAYYDDSWCWVAGYDYSPAWVDWRYGSGHVGWRPTEPRPSTGGGRFRDHRDGRPGDARNPTVAGGGRFRDHRDGRPGDARNPNRPQSGSVGSNVRDHRSNRPDWTWVREENFPAKGVRDFVVRNPSIRWDATPVVSRPPVKSRANVAAATLMRPRIQSRIDAIATANNATGGGGYRPSQNPAVANGAARPYQPVQPYRPRPSTSYQPPGTTRPYQPPYQPSTGYQPPASTYQPPRNAYQPSRPAPPTYQPPSRDPGRFTPPSAPPSRGYSPPSSYSPPTRSAPPSHSAPPSRSYSPPSAPSRSYSPPSRSSSSSSSSSSHSSSSSRSSSSSSHSFGGRRR